MRYILSSCKNVSGEISVPGDKSISQRAFILNSIANGRAHVGNICVGDDKASVLRCLRSLGVRIVEHSNCRITNSQECFEVFGKGRFGMSKPVDMIFAGNSGTAMRLIVGLLAGSPFYSEITGDDSLVKRPMGRIMKPLSLMGAEILSQNGNDLPPLLINGKSLQGIEYKMPISSAQVKSSLMIAALHSEGKSEITQPSFSRDHTERMMLSMGADIVQDGLKIIVNPSDLTSKNITVPGDISSAAFWMVLGCIHPSSEIKIANIGINSTRLGIIDVLKSMNANLILENEREINNEPIADVIVKSSDLENIEISGDLVPRIIDELPVLALAACFAKGQTVVKDAEELKFKESDRISATVEGLSNLGADIIATEDGFIINGGKKLRGGNCFSYGDHRIAMTMAIAGIMAEGTTTIIDAEAVDVSYPMFWHTLKIICDSLDLRKNE
ncbi:MAG: 3-phosphoshikimate 1-carboxyvinyltransferase [SAR202 cluster bacterium]|nr:3-phosphoshikimate 1-carboxyvinyltransferase [SAR202 cluster bacterium]|tara:strand:+ start:39611 stop:40939 length:1329 start_codon:yes stop_codon:yes gene_type:complete